MGCDCHVFVERRQPNGYWRCVLTRDQAYSARNYCVFYALAEVRGCWGEIETLGPPRGLPTDVSSEAAVYLMSVDIHSRSWLALDELLAYDWNALPEGMGEPFALFLKHDLLPLGNPKDTRIVFGFDS